MTAGRPAIPEGGGAARGYWLLVAPLALVVVCLYLYPIGQVLWVSLTDPSFGLQNYEQLFTSSSVQRILLTTVKIAAVTTVVAVAAGYLVAYVMAHAGRSHLTWIFLAVLVPFWVSVLVRAFSWLMLLHDGGLLNSALQETGLTTQPIQLVRNELGAIIGMVHYMIPYAVLPIYANMRTIEPSYVRAARGLGAGAFTAFRAVYLPMTLPAVIGASLLVFILTLGFFVTPAILGGGKTVMVAEYVSVQILQIARWGVAAMMATVLLLAMLLLLATLDRFVSLRSLFGAK